MSNKLRMLIKNVLDTTTLTLDSGTPVSSLPLDNVKIYSNSQIFRTLSTSTVITGSFAGYELITGCVLWRHNLSNTAKIRLELFASDDQSQAAVYDSQDVHALPHITLNDWDWRTQPIVASVQDNWPTRYSQIWPTATYAKSFRLTITDADNADGLIDITRIYLGRHFEPTFNFSYGKKQGLVSNETQYRTDGGSLHSQASIRSRKEQFTLGYLNEQDVPVLSDAILDVGLTKDWFVSFYPDVGGHKEIKGAFACKFTELPDIESVAYNIYKSDLSVEES